VKNIVSLLSALWVTFNLLIGFTFLLPVSIISWLVPIPAVSRGCTFIVDHIYRFAVKTDSFWMIKVVGIELIIKGKASTDHAPVVICNHRSWFDIPLVQEVITGNGPIIKFLVKREIAWVPIIGWICLALNFPMLQRRKKHGARQHDFSIIQKATKTHGAEAGALLVFPEGSRFSDQKKANQESPYNHLLKPKIGGLKVIKQHANPDTSLVDVTINYHQKDIRIWNCLHGDPRRITITLEHYKLAEIDDLENWLNDRWLAKDKILSAE
jgi:1-acyl-sn-glycerol-3-phosphate acyltransferase